MLSDFLKKAAKAGNAYLKIKAIPNQPRTEIGGWLSDGTLKIALNARAEKGRANKKLLSFLAGELGLSQSRVKIISGAASRKKMVKIDLAGKK